MTIIVKKKDTEDDIFHSSQVGQELKRPWIKQDIKAGELYWLSPVNIEAIKYNPSLTHLQLI